MRGHNITLRVVGVVALTVLLFTAPLTAAGSVAAQDSAPVNSTDTGTTAESIEYDLSDDVDIVNVNWSAGGARDVHITLRAEDRALVSVTDSGAVQALSSNSGTGVPVRDYWISEGTTTIEFTVQNDQLVTIGSGDGLYASAGDRGTLQVLTSAPTTTLVQVAVLAGGIGTILALALVVVYLKRQHENTYKELLSEERVRVEESPSGGWWARIKRSASRHKVALGSAAGIFAYLLLVAAGVVPRPGVIWAGMSDIERVISVGSLVMALVMFIPVYALVSRVWEPATEYIVDIDARDVLDPSLGSNSGLALDADDIEDVADDLEDMEDMEVVAVYSGSPDRVRKMKVDGEAAEVRTPGGKGHLVEDFSPKRNAARGTWPGTANDVEIISERSKIDGNREVLRDESRMLRTLIGALPAIATASDTSAMRSVDQEIRELATVDSDPIDSLLNRAASGTRFEGMYTDDDPDDDGEEESGLEQVVNTLTPGDDDDDDEDGGESGS